MPNCPHCSKDLPGLVDQETLRARLKSKDEEIGTLATEIKALAPLKEVAKERDRIAAELAEVRDASAWEAALDEVGVPKTPAVRAGFRTIYNSAVASAEEGKAPTPADWLAAPAKEHPLLAPHFTAQGTAQGTATGGVQTDRGVVGAPSAVARKIKTPAELAAYFASKEYRALKPDEQAAKRSELRADLTPAR